jgi:hypothetical protein
MFPSSGDGGGGGGGRFLHCWAPRLRAIPIKALRIYKLAFPNYSINNTSREGLYSLKDLPRNACVSKHVSVLTDS